MFMVVRTSSSIGLLPVVAFFIPSCVLSHLPVVPVPASPMWPALIALLPVGYCIAAAAARRMLWKDDDDDGVQRAPDTPAPARPTLTTDQQEVRRACVPLTNL